MLDKRNNWQGIILVAGFSMSGKTKINVSKPEELAYWSRLLRVTPGQLINAVKATGSNLLSRMIYYLKAEGVLPQTFDLETRFG